MKGATKSYRFHKPAFFISIHAPMKGATKSYRFHKPAFFISIHAPMKGATKNFTYIVLTGLNFNPRTHEGCDTVLLIGLGISL